MRKLFRKRCESCGNFFSTFEENLSHCSRSCKSRKEYFDICQARNVTIKHSEGRRIINQEFTCRNCGTLYNKPFGRTGSKLYCSEECKILYIRAGLRKKINNTVNNQQ